MNGENISIRKVRDNYGLEPTDGKGFHEGVVWDDIIIPPEGLRAPQNAPDRVVLIGNIDVYAFDGGTTLEELSGSFELPHNYREGGDLRPHIHFTTKDGGSGNVKWNIEYTISNIDESFGNTVTISGVKTVQATPVLKSLAVETNVIDGLLLHIGAQCHFRLFRDPTDPEDTYSGDALLSSIGIHYEIDGDGSRDIFTK